MQIFGFSTHGGPEVASLMEVPEPTPGPGEILIETVATSVNPGDLGTREGTSSFTVKFPMAMGREAAGRVRSLGDGVTHVSPGELVFGSAAAGSGTFGELALLDAAATAPVPHGLDVVAAACVPVAYGTAYDILDQLGLERGQTAVLIGAGGGVGTAVCSLARARGSGIVGVASAGKRETVTRLGGTHVESGQGWVQRVREAVERPDALIDMVGGEVLDAGRPLVPAANRIISIADPQRTGAAGGGGVTRRRTRNVYGRVAALLAEDAAEVTISRVFPLRDAAAAVAAVESGHAEGKVAVTVQE